MAIEWSFPSNNFGTLNGIGEAGIETFKGAPYRSLAREICQNSLDARAPGAQGPVRVEFCLTREATGAIPGIYELREALSSCRDFWRVQGNSKTVTFFEKAVRLSSAPDIAVLRVSDFNTTGLTGSDKEFNSPWQDLVKASGVSGKGGASGGSFGIGKSAPFACSALRTVFYATRDINDLKAFQGIARLVSFRRKNTRVADTDNVTTGIGYYGESRHNRAVRSWACPVKGFLRTEVGTDVFIVGFTGDSGWSREVVKAVLEDFLIAVYRGMLEVTVQGTRIGADTLPQVIEQYREEAVTAYNYYQVLTAKETHRRTLRFKELGEIEVMILLRPELHRRVMIDRSNGMKIFDQKNISGSIQFAGICVLADEGINSYFRQMENPQHDAWEPERHSSPSQAKKDKTELARLIKSMVLELGRKTTVDEVDAEGMGEYLPDQAELSAGNGGTVESVDAGVGRLELTTVKKKRLQPGYESTDSGELSPEDTDTPETDPFGDGNNGTSGAPGPEKRSGAGGGDAGSAPGTGNGSHGGGSADAAPKRQGARQLRFLSVRVFQTDAAHGRYRVVFTPKTAHAQGYLRFRLSGEQSSVAVRIGSASMNGRPLACRENCILLERTEAGQRVAVDFTIDYTDPCAMEVSLYGYPV